MRRGWVQWTLAGVLAVAGTAATLMKAVGWEHWTWLMITSVVVTTVIGIPSKVVTARIDTLAKRTQEARDTLSIGAVGAGLRRVRDIADPIVLGIHPAGLPVRSADAVSTAAARTPAYIRRDQHEAVISRLTPGRFVLIQGDSGAGKSRLAFEALKTTVPRHRLFAPEPPALTAAIDQMRQTRAAVLWLDDLDRFLEADTLTATAITELLAGHSHQRVIIATLRHQARESLTATGDQSDYSVVDRRQRVLELADPVLISRQFTTTELDRAQHHRHDSRIADALAHAETYGLAEYLAAGPQLLNKWLAGYDTHPRGAALVAAAIDCRRAGYIAPLPKPLLSEVYTHYLPANPRTRLEDLAAAWAWATELWRNTAAILEPANTDDTVIIFDYLVDHVQRTTAIENDPPEDILLAALTYTDATTAAAIGFHAHQRARYALAHAAYNKALAFYHDIAPIDVIRILRARAVVLHDLDQLDEAERELRLVLDTTIRLLGIDHPDTLVSRNNLASVLAKRHDFAILFASGDDRAKMLGQRVEAEREHRAIFDAAARVWGPNHPNSLTIRDSLAQMLSRRGKLDEAESEHRLVLDARIKILGMDHPGTLTSRNNLAQVLYDLGKSDESEREHRIVLDTASRVLGANHRVTRTIRHNLVVMLRDQGKHDDAMREYDRGKFAEHPEKEPPKSATTQSPTFGANVQEHK